MDVHYYEDGNVRMSTSKKVEVGSTTGADAVVREIARAENKFQEELNKAFTSLAEGSFKGLRRQLPVTRQRVDWEKIGGYRVSLTTSQRLFLTINGHLLTLYTSWAKTSVVADRSNVPRAWYLKCCAREWQSWCDPVASKYTPISVYRPDTGLLLAFYAA